jgi:hypothetical protein
MMHAGLCILGSLPSRRYREYRSLVNTDLRPPTPTPELLALSSDGQVEDRKSALSHYY